MGRRYLILFLISFRLLASDLSYYPEQFLSKKDQLKNEELKSELHRIVSFCHQQIPEKHDLLIDDCSTPNSYKHIPLHFDDARKLIFGKIDLQQQENGEYFVHDVYCNFDVTGNGIAPHAIPVDRVINLEHTWPKSYFEPSMFNFEKSDLHHLFPTDSRANSNRNNSIFGEPINGRNPFLECTDSWSGYIPNPNLPGKRIRVYSPPDLQKGRTARAIFYFAIRYGLSIDEIEESTLRKWHRDFPVDSEDIRRNHAIFLEQKNRNPFIDYPELVDSISDF